MTIPYPFGCRLSVCIGYKIKHKYSMASGLVLHVCLYFILVKLCLKLDNYEADRKKNKG